MLKKSVVFLCTALLLICSSVHLSAMPVVFLEGLILPGINRTVSFGDNAKLKERLSRHCSSQALVAFLVDVDEPSTWGCAGLVSSVDEASATIQLRDLVEVFTPRATVKEVPVTDLKTNTTYTELMTLSYRSIGSAALSNMLPSQFTDAVLKIVHRKFKTKQLMKDLTNATTCNQFIQILVERLKLEIAPDKAIEFLTQSPSVERKLNLLVELIIKQHKSIQSNPDDDQALHENFRDALQELVGLPKSTYAFIDEIIDRYERNKQSPHEGPALETYLKFIFALPWKETISPEAESYDLEKVAQTLDAYQYGMEQVKDLVLTHLALRIVSQGSVPLVLCLVGKPGTGKTSICHNIAKALDKKVYRISLAGSHTQSDIVGHNRAYVNATEGKILRALKTTKSASPVIILDEIDKMGTQNEWHGSPADALLHALDPEQNATFSDDYLGTPFDISRVLFIATANNEREIPQALRDRMMIVQVPSYSRAEKIKIAQTIIVPRLLGKIGLISHKPSFSDDVIGAIVDRYTFEDGLRGLTNQLNFLIGKFARGYLRNEAIVFTVDNLASFLGAAHNNLAEFKRKAKEVEPYLEPLTRKKLFEAIESFDVAKERTDEHERLRAYISTFLQLPWAPEIDTTNYNSAAVARALDESHYGTEEVKEQILDYLTMAERAAGSSMSTTLCLFGSPGVGKTSIAEAVAKALNKKFIRISMGGITSPHDVRGVSSEYSSGHAGAIAKALIDAGSRNAVVVLDEIDKIPHVSIANTLLDVLDPTQNKQFLDEYVGAPIDLSQILFIATANNIQQIPGPLFDRMKMVSMTGYSKSQKITIASGYIIPRILAKNRLQSLPFITPELLGTIIDNYTYEVGLRQLTSCLKTLVARYIRALEGKTEFNPTEKDLANIFGAPMIHDKASKDQIGVVNGLTYSMTYDGNVVGGSVMPIQVALVPGGHGRVIITGKLREMCKDSIEIAFSYVKTNYIRLMQQYAPDALPIDPRAPDHFDIHVHALRAANEKDGPSAGLAFCTALISLLTQRPFDHTCAMTGEIDLNGNALAIGGLAQKLEGARRDGVCTVFAPEENRASVETYKGGMPKEIKLVYVNHIEEILPHVLLPQGPNPQYPFSAPKESASTASEGNSALAEGALQEASANPVLIPAS